MVIRPYHEADEEQVIALWRACNLVVPWNDPAKDIARKLEVQRELFFVGICEERVVATVMASYDGHRGWLNYVAVAPELQQQGLGRQMMETVEAELTRRGCPKINLQVRTSNQAVIEFYKRLGFKLDDVVSLGKRLRDDSETD
jgi:ribosomal protein S18 acetylase RimI-like enzyme